MCCGISRSKIKRLGVILSLIYFFFSIICLILAAVNYNILFTNFTEDGWQSLAAVQIASILYVFIIFVVGLVTFRYDRWLLTIIV